MYIFGKYEVVTPLMLGGANHAPEFRLASYVHMLRWWWRFLALSRFETVERATYWEAVLFGWHTKGFGRKRVSFRLLSLEEDEFPKSWSNGLDQDNWSGIKYLTAQGFSERTPVEVRGFKVEALLTKRKLNIDKEREADTYWPLAQQTLVDAMVLIGMLGGLGARSRRGFGSLAVLKLEVEGGAGEDNETLIDGRPADTDTYKELIDKHLGAKRHPDLPPYSAFSDQFDFQICASHENARELMNDIGWAFQIYRSYGQSDRNGGHIHRKTSETSSSELKAGADKGWYNAKFKGDHDVFYANPFDNKTFDNRAVFGLPHNYGNADVGLELTGNSKRGRRPSPLLFHFHRLGNGKTVFVASVVEAKFAPDGAKLRVEKGRRNTHKDFPTAFQETHFPLLHDFAIFLRNKNATGSGEGVHDTTFEGVL